MVCVISVSGQLQAGSGWNWRGPAPTLSPSFLLAQATFEPKLFPYKYSNILKVCHPSYLSACEDGTECSETSAYKIQTSRNYPEESIQHSEHGESLKSRILHLYGEETVMEQSVPKRRHIKFRRRGITQKKAYNIQNTAKV